jgi:hypothetical protein
MLDGQEPQLNSPENSYADSKYRIQSRFVVSEMKHVNRRKTRRPHCTRTRQNRTYRDSQSIVASICKTVSMEMCTELSKMLSFRKHPTVSIEHYFEQASCDTMRNIGHK